MTILDKSKYTFKIKCIYCGTTAWRKSDTMVCYKCHWNQNCPEWMKRNVYMESTLGYKHE